MTRPPSAPLRVLLLAAWGVLPAVGYAAPPSPEARARPEVRVEAEIRGALKKGDLEAAAEKVQKARDADPSSAALALLAAQIKTKQEEPAGAMRAYQDYLRLAGASAPTKERAEAVMKIQDLSVEVGSIVVRAKAKGARVLVDGTFVGVTPLPEPVPVMPGKHVLALEGSSAKATVSVKEEQSVTVELEGAAPASVATAGPATAPTTASSKKGAKEAPAKEPAKEAAKETPQEPPLDRRPIWKELDPFAPEKPEKAEGPAAAAAAAPQKEAPAPAGGGGSRKRVGFVAAGALALGSAATAVLASAAISDFESKKDTLGTTRDELESAQGKATLLAGVSVALGVGAISVVTITLLSGRGEAKADASPGTKPAPTLGLFMAPSFVGARGTFQ